MEFGIGYGIAFDGAGTWYLVMTTLGMLQFLMLIIVHHLIVTKPIMEMSTF